MNISLILNAKVVLTTILTTTVLLHILLAVYSPYPDGYVYDFYSEAAVLLYHNGVLPTRGDCWTCYHPPLLAWLGSFIFTTLEAIEANLFINITSFASVLNAISLVLIYYSYKVYLQYRIDQGIWFDLAILALICFLPVTVISAHAIESDVITSTLIVSALYYFGQYQQKEKLIPLITASALLGLAALAKYVGALVAAILGVVLLCRWIMMRNKTRFMHGVIFALVVGVIGLTPYIKNYQTFNTPFPGNTEYGFGDNSGVGDHRSLYNFTNFSLHRIVNTFTDKNPQELGVYDVYSHEYISSHYGQLWSDHSIFTVKGRHGLPYRMNHHSKDIPLWLIWAVLLGGLPITILAVLGAMKLVTDRNLTLLNLIAAVTLFVYIRWTFTNHEWMLKTKYFLFLTPLFVLAISNIFTDRKHLKYKMAVLLPAVGVSTIYGFFFALS